MLRKIDKFLFEEGLGLSYRWYQKIFGLVGVILGIGGIVGMLVYFNTQVEFLYSANVALIGIVMMGIVATRARTRKIKELSKKS